MWLNRGKESVVLDIKKPEDKALLERMLARADVFIQNLAPGAMARAGFGSAALRARHPRLITVDISGYGESGDYAEMKAYDLLVQAESGLCCVTGRPEGPGRVGVSACDIACGMNAHAAVLEALIERGVTGRGKGIAVSLFDGMADWMNVPLLQFEGTGKAPQRIGLAHPSICPYGAFRDARRRAGADLDPERARVGVVLRAVPGASRTCRSARASAATSSAWRTAPVVDAHIGRIFASPLAGRVRGQARAANTAYGFVNDVRGAQRTTRRCGALRSRRRTGRCAIGAPAAVLSATGSARSARCRRSASTPPGARRVRGVTCGRRPPASMLKGRREE